MHNKQSVFLNFEKSRSEEFTHNIQLNNLIKELKFFLEPLQEKVNEKYSGTKWPIGIVIGAPRSGTTLLTQWLASLDLFSYPSNLITRFAYAPYIGSLIQKMLLDSDYDFHGDFQDIQSEVNFKSNLGMSKGALAINSFSHFFRKYLNHYDPRYIYSEELDSIDTEGINNGIASIEDAFGKPFISKGMMLQYNIEFFHKKIPNLFFFYIKRDPLMNMQSLLIARKKYFNDYEKWYSARPKEFEKLERMDKYHQVAGQIYYTNKSIEKELNELEEKNRISIKYEEFCKDPSIFFYEMKKKYKINKYNIDGEYSGIRYFTTSCRKILSNEELDRLSKAYNFFKEIEGDSHSENP